MCKTRFILAISSIVLLLSGCMIPPQPDDIKVEGIQPKWITQLATTCLTYNDGLIGLPLYNDKVLFNSTNFSRLNSVDKNIFEEDNRINALDVNTGKRSWVFPEQYDSLFPLLFDSTPYIFNEYLLLKMPAPRGVEGNDRLLCINMETGKEVWRKIVQKNISYKTGKDVIGFQSDYFIFQETKQDAMIYSGNILHSEITPLYTFTPSEGYDCVDFTGNAIYYESTENKPTLLLFLFEKNFTTRQDSITSVIFDVNKNQIVAKQGIYRKDKTYRVTRSIFYNSLAYVNYGSGLACINPHTNQIMWQYDSSEPVDFHTPLMCINSNVVFLYFNNRYAGLDAQTGHKLYQGDIECANADAFDGRVYLIGRRGYLHVLDIKTGKELHRITCPEMSKTGDGFSHGCKPQVHGDKLFVFSYTSAYCYALTDLK